MKKNNQKSVTGKNFLAAKKIVRIAQAHLREVLPMVPDDEKHSDLRDRMTRAINRNDLSRSNILRAVLPQIQELIEESVGAVRKLKED